MFPSIPYPLPLCPSFLRASGGVSMSQSLTDAEKAFSPRKRRCFCRRFGGFFRRCGFLRASGGVSTYLRSSSPQISFSPRKRRCFWLCKNLASYLTVFSAQAEVFLRLHAPASMAACFLRASGGVSAFTRARVYGSVFSPRKRRCFSVMIRSL